MSTKTTKENDGGEEIVKVEEETSFSTLAKEMKEVKDKKDVKETPKMRIKKPSAPPKASTPKVLKPTAKTTKRSATESAEEETDSKKSKVKEAVTRFETKAENEVKDKFNFTEGMLDEFDISFKDTSTQVPLDDTLILKGVLKVVEATVKMDEEEPEDEEDGDAKDKADLLEKIKVLQKTVQEGETEVAELKEEMEQRQNNAKEKEVMAMGTINSLEIEKEELQAKLDKYRRTVPNLMQELQKLRTDVVEPTKTGGASNKGETTKLKKALKDATEKLEEVSKEKTKFESEAKRMHGICDNQDELLKHYRARLQAGTASAAPASPTAAATAPPTPATPAPSKETKNSQDKKSKCFRFEKGICKKKECNFFHPSTVCREFTERGVCGKWECMDLHTGTHRGDCWYWKQGSCKFDEVECGKGRHLPEMFDVNSKLRAGEVQAPTTTPAPASFLGGGHSPTLTELLRSTLARGREQEAVAPAPVVTAGPGGDDELRSLVMQLLVQQGMGARGQGQ